MRNSVIIAAADFDVHRRKTTVVGGKERERKTNFVPFPTILQKVFIFT